jgi:chloride channel protein, CIC family
MPDGLTPGPLRPGEPTQADLVSSAPPAGTVPPAPAPPPPALLRGRAGWRRFASWAGSHVNRMSYFVRWLILGAVIGTVAGLGAIVFYEALRLSTELFLQVLANYRIPTPSGEGGLLGSASYLRPWAIPLVVVAGGLLAGFLIFTWAPEAEGHGTDAAIDAVHHNPRGIRLRAVVVKIVASALTIGSGGSGGREGPTAQISAGFGSLLARVLDLSPEDGRIAVSVGIGSGIGAIFGAPLGGAVLAADVVYRDDFEYEALLPGVFASIIAYAIFGAVYGYHPLFSTPAYRFHQPIQLLWFAVIGVLAGGVGLLYSKGFYGVIGLSSRLPLSRKLRPAVGALFVGLIALGLPEVLGTGYGWVQESLENELLHTPLWIVLLLPFARIAATAFSIGSGGSGGVFGPGMVIGAFTGMAFWRLFEPFAPGVGHTPAPYVVVGMMAVFGGISRAPLAVMVMVAEMTGSIQILAPALVAVALSTFIVSKSDDSIYRSQLRTRADSEASRLQFGLPLLNLVEVAKAATPPKLVLRDDTPLGEALDKLRTAGVPGAPVVDEDGWYLGTVDLSRVVRLLQPAGVEAPGAAGEAGEREEDQAAAGTKGAPEARPALGAAASPDGTAASLTVAAAIDATTTTVPDTARLNVGLEALVQAGGNWVTVTSARRVVGILSIADVVRGYQAALAANAGQIAAIPPGAVTIEERVGADSPVADVPLSAAGLPPGCIIVSVQRGEHMLFATGSTTLEHADLVSALANPTTAEAARRMIRGTDQPKPPMVERGSQMV